MTSQNGYRCELLSKETLAAYSRLNYKDFYKACHGIFQTDGNDLAQVLLKYFCINSILLLCPGQNAGGDLLGVSWAHSFFSDKYEEDETYQAETERLHLFLKCSCCI